MLMEQTWSSAVVSEVFDEEGIVADGVDGTADIVTVGAQWADQKSVIAVPLGQRYQKINLIHLRPQCESSESNRMKLWPSRRVVHFESAVNSFLMKWLQSFFK